MLTKLSALCLVVVASMLTSPASCKRHMSKRGGPACSHPGGSTGTHCAKMDEHTISYGINLNDGSLDCTSITRDNKGDQEGRGNCLFKDGARGVTFICDGEDESYITVNFGRDFSGMDIAFGDFIDFYWESKADQPTASYGGPLNTTVPDDNIIIDCYT